MPTAGSNAYAPGPALVATGSARSGDSGGGKLDTAPIQAPALRRTFSTGSTASLKRADSYGSNGNNGNNRGGGNNSNGCNDGAGSGKGKGQAMPVRKHSASVATSVHMEMGAVQLVSRFTPKPAQEREGAQVQARGVATTDSAPAWQRQYVEARNERKNKLKAQRKAALLAARDATPQGQGEVLKKTSKGKNKVHVATASPLPQGHAGGSGDGDNR